MMKPVNIRLYFVGFFVTKNCKIEYRHLELSLHPNVEEVFILKWLIGLELS